MNVNLKQREKQQEIYSLIKIIRKSVRMLGRIDERERERRGECRLNPLRFQPSMKYSNQFLEQRHCDEIYAAANVFKAK